MSLHLAWLARSDVCRQHRDESFAVLTTLVIEPVDAVVTFKTYRSTDFLREMMIMLLLFMEIINANLSLYRFKNSIYIMLLVLSVQLHGHAAKSYSDVDDRVH